MIRRIPSLLAAALIASAAPLAAQTTASQTAQTTQAAQNVQAEQNAQDSQPSPIAQSARRARGAVSQGAVSQSTSGSIASSSTTAPEQSKLEVTVIPAGALFFQSAGNDSEPSFNSYSYGAGVTYWVNKFVGIEGELLGSVGRRQSLDTAIGSIDAKTPNTLMYSGSAVYAINGHRSPLVPYVAAGIGGLTLFEQREVGVDERTTLLTVNVGGGVKWYHGSWGVRGDYRFIAVPSKDDAPGFFGQETRYGHRVYGGLFLGLPSFR
jgi:hypothetical protein